VIVGICFVDLFVNYSARLGYGVVLPEMIRTLGFGRTAGGSIYNSYLFAYIVFSPFTGYLTDRVGARRVITICLLILGVGVFLMGTVHALWSACIIYGIVGLGAAGLWGPVITLVQRWLAFHRRGFALGILATGYCHHGCRLSLDCRQLQLALCLVLFRRDGACDGGGEWYIFKK
jgi:MFS family permease